MHPNPTFGKEPRQQNIAFARERAFGTLAVNGEDGPITAHIPFVLNEEGTHLELHLMRSNPIARAELPAKATLTILGPDSYISPDWYDAVDQVPTWNYIAVRIKGTLTLEPHADLHPLLDRLSAHMEANLLPKPPWTTGKMSDGVMERMMRALQPLSMAVDSIEGTWKLGQNKPDQARHNAADHVKAYGIGQELNTLAGLMHGAKEDDP
jgi:transcriptional regulator